MMFQQRLSSLPHQGTAAIIQAAAAALLLLTLATTTCKAEVVPFDTCGHDTERPSNCTITQVRINPCPEVLQKLPCVMKKRSHAIIEFDYKTDYPANRVKSQAFWKTSVDDKPLAGMDRNACNNTPCPVVENQQHFYNNTVEISRKFPPRGYNVKWVLWDENESSFECCFIFKIKLVP